MTSNTRAVLLALLGFATFATHDVIVKVLGGSYSPFQIVFFSVLFGFPIATVMLLRDGTMGNLIPRYPLWTGARTLAAVGTGVCAFYAFSVLPLAQTYAIIFASPLLITVLAIPVLGEKVGLRRWLAVLVGLIGVLVVLRPGTTTLTLGHLAALGCAVCGALASVIVRKIGREERSIVLIIYPLVANFVLMAAVLPFVYQPMPIEHLGMSFCVALLATVAMLCIIEAYRLGEAVVVAPMQYSQILWATGFGMVLFGERPDLNTALGAGVIIASGVYIVLREGGGANASSQPVLRTRSRVGTPSTTRVSAFFRARGEEPPQPAVTDQGPARPAMRGLPGRSHGAKGKQR